jgi:hypothetical protein
MTILVCSDPPVRPKASELISAAGAATDASVERRSSRRCSQQVEQTKCGATHPSIGSGPSGWPKGSIWRCSTGVGKDALSSCQQGI